MESERTGHARGCSDSALGVIMLALHRSILTCVLICGVAAPSVLASQFPPNPWPKGPDILQPGDRKWPDWLEETAKRLEKSKSIGQPGPELEFLNARASDLLERAKSSRDNYFRFGRFIAAANAMLEAGDRMVWLRKAERTPQEQDFWGAGFIMPGCYFRVRQAEFFSSLSGEKNGEQYVTWSKSFYQLARVAYDAHEYQRARLYGDASSFIVFALECIAQATVQMPDAAK
jgi:hypothetical protein